MSTTATLVGKNVFGVKSVGELSRRGKPLITDEDIAKAKEMMNTEPSSNNKRTRDDIKEEAERIEDTKDKIGTLPYKKKIRPTSPKKIDAALEESRAGKTSTKSTSIWASLMGGKRRKTRKHRGSRKNKKSRRR